MFPPRGATQPKAEFDLPPLLSTHTCAPPQTQMFILTSDTLEHMLDSTYGHRIVSSCYFTEHYVSVYNVNTDVKLMQQTIIKKKKT